MRRSPFLWVCLGLSGTALAQSPARLERFERQLEQIQRQSRLLVDPSIPPTDRAIFDYGGYLSVSYLALDDSVGKSHGLRQYELVGYGRLNFDGAHELFARGRATYNDFNTGQSFDGRGDDFIGPLLERFHYRFDLQRSMAAYHGKVIEANLVAQVGRQLVTWANGLTLSEVIDGAVLTGTWGGFSLEFIAGVTWDKDVDFDISRPNFRNHTERGVYGAFLTAPPLDTRWGRHQFFAFGLAQRDYNHGDTFTANAVTTRFNYNSYYVGLGASGNIGDNLLYGVEFVYEGGQNLSNSFNPADGSQLVQTEDPISAYALDVRIDYLLADPQRTRFAAELILATGDDDRLASNSTFGGNRPGTVDRGFASLGLLNTGLAFAPAVSNLAMIRFGGSTIPFPGGAFRQMQVGVDLLVFAKFDADAPIDEPTNNDRYLGTEGDFYLNWQISSDVTLALRYGIFFPGSAITGDDSPRNFIFAGVTYAF